MSREYLYPAIYSKGQTVEAIAMTITKFPEQKPNTKEALNGLVFDYTLNSSQRGPYGSLLEIYAHAGWTEMLILCTNGMVEIDYKDGKFIVGRTVVKRDGHEPQINLGDRKN